MGLEVNIQTYEVRLNQALQDYIVLLDHIVTGEMYRSIDFKIDVTNESFNLSLTANDYIVYLDDGQFLENFYNLQSTQDILTNLTEDFANSLLDSAFPGLF